MPAKACTVGGFKLRTGMRVLESVSYGEQTAWRVFRPQQLRSAEQGLVCQCQVVGQTRLFQRFAIRSNTGRLHLGGRQLVAFGF